MACPLAGGEVAPLSSDKIPPHGKPPAAQFCHPVSVRQLFPLDGMRALPIIVNRLINRRARLRLAFAVIRGKTVSSRLRGRRGVPGSNTEKGKRKGG
jgi:hypothetical protein